MARAPRRLGTRRVASLVGRILDPAARARGFAAAGLLTDWEGIVGPALAGRCRPVEVRFERGRRAGGTLVLEAGGGAALELQHATPQILERINSHFGFAAVRGLRFLPARLPIQVPPPPPSRSVDAETGATIEAVVADIADPALRAALATLGRTVAARALAPPLPAPAVPPTSTSGRGPRRREG